MNQEQIEIITRVHDLYMRYGIKSVTMDDVARELGMSKKTLYQYFADKSELVEAVINQEMQNGTAIVEELLTAKVDAITEMLHIHQFMDKMARRHSHVTDYDLKKYYPAVYAQLLKFKREKTYTIWKNNMEKGKSEGLYRSEVNVEIIAKTNLLRSESSMDTCIFSSEELMSKDFFMEIFIYHIRGIATQAGIERLEELLKQQQ